MYNFLIHNQYYFLKSSNVNNTKTITNDNNDSFSSELYTFYYQIRLSKVCTHTYTLTYSYIVYLNR